MFWVFISITVIVSTFSFCDLFIPVSSYFICFKTGIDSCKNIIKNNSTDKLELTDELLLSEFTQDLATCKIIAKEKRPEINKLKIAITQSEKDIKIAKADKNPTLNLSVGTNWDKAFLPSRDNNSWNAGVTASWNVFLTPGRRPT